MVPRQGLEPCPRRLRVWYATYNTCGTFLGEAPTSPISVPIGVGAVFRVISGNTESYLTNNHRASLPKPISTYSHRFRSLRATLRYAPGTPSWTRTNDHPIISRALKPPELPEYIIADSQSRTGSSPDYEGHPSCCRYTIPAYMNRSTAEVSCPCFARFKGPPKTWLCLTGYWPYTF